MMMLSNEEIVALRRPARRQGRVRGAEVRTDPDRRAQGDTTLQDDISHFLEASDHYHRLVFRILDAVHGGINEDLPPGFLGIAYPELGGGDRGPAHPGSSQAARHGSTPVTGRTDPSRASSPMEAWPSRRSSSLLRQRMAIAMARSNVRSRPLGQKHAQLRLR